MASLMQGLLFGLRVSSGLSSRSGDVRSGDVLDVLSRRRDGLRYVDFGRSTRGKVGRQIAASSDSAVDAGLFLFGEGMGCGAGIFVFKKCVESGGPAEVAVEDERRD